MKSRKLVVIVFASFVLVGSCILGFDQGAPEVKAQHHGAPPPAAALGDRKVVLDMHTDPANITQGNDALMKIGFLDEGKNMNIQHVTFRMDVSKDEKHILSGFFHDHNGEVRLMFKGKGGGDSSKPVIGGTQDVLTNAWIADPGSPITISGPVFNQSGTYNVGLELTTIDNDKTDLVEPLEYQFDVDVS